MPSERGDSLISKHDAECLQNAFRTGGTFCADLPPAPGIALVCLKAFHLGAGSVVAVTDGPVTADTLLTDIGALAPDANDAGSMLLYPGHESFPGHGTDVPARVTGDRLRALTRLASGGKVLLVTSTQALMQKIPPPSWIIGETLDMGIDEEWDPGELLLRLERNGYAFEPEVLAPGQASWRGSILDAWPPGEASPVRVEFFGNTIESLRRFDPVEQRSIDRLDRILITPAHERPETGETAVSLLDYLPADTATIWVDHPAIQDHAALYERSAAEAAAEDSVIAFDRIEKECERRFTGPRLCLGMAAATDDAWSFDFTPLTGVPAPGTRQFELDIIEARREKFLADLYAHAGDGWTLDIYFATQGSLDRFRESSLPGDINTANIALRRGILSESCLITDRRRIILSDADIYGRRRDTGERARDRRRRLRKKVSGERMHAWTDMQPGDYVVHVDHGIGIYRGLLEIRTHGTMQEVLAVEYADKAKIYIPTGQSHLLSRYIGVGKRHPRLHALGGKRWSREKSAAERAVEDLAAQLLETQASRDAKAGHAFSPDTPWQLEFEQSFPFEETVDQALAIEEVKKDMESSRPMDRLVCGDVGYGKTEVAMRAAFKAVMDGKQTAILVPTTVLAQQHFDTFTERMGAFPLRIEMLSRFQNRAQQHDILERLAAGKVDVIIGTHRLVQKDVRFNDLGLVIIDEEQRFGVKHKEHLKQLRRLVDVLTMTATPIPRTLYMSLTGAKDLSIIESAPVERLPIETVITENRDDIVREAILRELNREGQVYYLHNRVQTIEHVRDKLVRLVPEARVRIAHGQMKEGELSSIMRAFTRGEFDLLLCTTIIESGLNIPNVNTILIDRADRFGLAELYQLRGRVGRYKRKAYAYLLLPKHGQLFFMARQRIGAVKRYSSLGSGFKLAMRDLELRGAGNILGSEQSGHIACVGFDLYCQLLQRTVTRLRGESPPPVVDVDLSLDFVALVPNEDDAAASACLPIHYVEDETMRVRLYRRVAAMMTREDLLAFRSELQDRFGPLPAPAERFLLLADIRLAAAAAGISRIEVNGEKIIMTRGGDYIMIEGRFPRLPAGDTSERLERLLRTVRRSGNKK